MQAIRDAIAAGTYETPEKIDRAVDGLILDLLDETPSGWETIDPAGD